MENASKALIIAGSILMALLVIGAASFMYRQLSKVEQAKTDVERSDKVIDYEKAFIQYDRTIYGSELLSLGNLQLDYNYRQADMKGYNPVSITVETKKMIKENNKIYLSAGTQSITNLRTALSKLEDDVAFYESDNSGYKNKKEKNKRSVKYYAQLSNRQIATLFDISYSSEELDYDIGDRLANRLQSPSTYKLMADIEIYKNLKTSYTEFKNSSFSCKDVQYDGVGRIKSMLFIQN